MAHILQQHTDIACCNCIPRLRIEERQHSRRGRDGDVGACASSQFLVKFADSVHFDYLVCSWRGNKAKL